MKFNTDIPNNIVTISLPLNFSTDPIKKNIKTEPHKKSDYYCPEIFENSKVQLLKMEKKYDNACKGCISNEDKHIFFCCVLNINDSPNTSWHVLVRHALKDFPTEDS